VLYLYYVSCVALGECVSASVWCPVVLEHFVCVVCFGVLCICIDDYKRELYIHDLRRAGVM